MNLPPTRREKKAEKKKLKLQNRLNEQGGDQHNNNMDDNVKVENEDFEGSFSDF